MGKMAPFALALLLLPFGGCMRKSAKRLGRVMSLLLLIGASISAMAGLTGCGASVNSNFVQPQQAYDLTVTIRQKIWGRDHPDTAYSLNNLGWIYLELGRWQLAEPLLKENLAIPRVPSARAGPLYVSSLANWGRVLVQKGDYSGAADAFNQAMQLLASGGHQESWSGAKIMDYQVLLDLDRSRYPDAVRLATRALQVERNVGGDNNPQLSNGLLVLGLAQLLADTPSEAEKSFRNALAFRQSTYPPTHPEVLLVQVRLAEALLAEGRRQDALDLMKPLLTAAKAAPFPLPAWRMAELQIVYALALRGIGYDKDAANLVNENTVQFQDYNLAALKTYLNRRANSLRRSVLSSEQSSLTQQMSR